MFHVVHIIDLLRVGGAQKLLITFAKTVSKRDDVKLTVVSLAKDSDSHIPDEIRASGARVISFPGNSLFDLGRIVPLIRYLRSVQCDIIQTHLTYANIIGTFAGRIAGTPVVATLHNTKTYFSGLKKTLEKLVLQYFAQRIVAVGYVVESANRKRFYGRNIDIIPNAVSMISPLSADERMQIRTEMTEDPTCPLVISVGRLTEQKAFPDLISAFSVVHQNHPSAVLVIVGEGRLKEQFTKQISDSGLDDCVILLGLRNDIPRLLAASDFFVCSSHWEGLPVALLEAMSAGLPIVSTSVGDVPKVVVEGTGVLVPANEPVQLAQAINKMLDNPDQMRIFGLAARSHIEHYYNHTVWLDQLMKLYFETAAVPFLSSNGKSGA